MATKVRLCLNIGCNTMFRSRHFSYCSTSCRQVGIPRTDYYPTAKLKSYKRKCRVCKGFNENYKVYEWLWELAGFKHWEFVCATCLSLKLKRNLELDDFVDHPINFDREGFNCIDFVDRQFKKGIKVKPILRKAK